MEGITRHTGHHDNCAPCTAIRESPHRNPLMTPEQLAYLVNCTVERAKVMLAAPKLLAALEWIQVNSRTIRHARAVAAEAIEEAKK